MAMVKLDDVARCLRDQFLVQSQTGGASLSRQVLVKMVEAIGSLLGIGGAAWLAFKITGFEWAYVPFALSSMALTWHFWQKKLGWVMLQQAVFTAINLGGIWVWLLRG